MLGVIFSLLGFIRSAVTAFLGLFRRYPLQVMFVCAVAACLWLYAGKQQALSALSNERAGRAADWAMFEDAQRNAAIRAQAAREATEARYKAQADKVDRDYAIALNIALRRARSLPAQTAGSAASHTTAATDNNGSSSGNRPSAAAILVNMTDVEVCTINTMRLEAVRAWALGVNDAD